MKITNALNNIFDQYDLDENRVTNALLQTFANHENFLRLFLKQCLNIHLTPGANVFLSSQKQPFAIGDTNKDLKKNESIPDGWIIIDEDRAAVIESKIVKDAIRVAQLKSHIKRIRDYPKRYLCLITPDHESPIKGLDDLDATICWISWRDVLNLVHAAQTNNAVAEYFKDSLKEYLAMKDDLVGFRGIDYPSGEYNPREAKIIIKNLINEIKADVNKTYPNLTFERKSYSHDVHAYTVYHRNTWSFLGTDENFTKDMHLTFWLGETHMGLGLTVPNNANSRWKRVKEIFRNDDFFNTFVNKLFDLRDNLPNLYLEFVHRHYLNQRDGIIDGIMEIDIDTIKGSRHVKANRVWIESLRELLKNKSGYNGQLMIRTRFFYKDHKDIKNPTFKRTVVETAKKFKDVYDYLH
jgi:hypothetical protein